MNNATHIDAEVVSATAHPLHTDEDVMRVRTLVRERAVELGLSLVDQTKFVTAASEIARNTIRHGGGGDAQIVLVARGEQRGCKLVFSDRGPGIADVELALTDGFTSAGGLGLGLGGARRLVDDFAIETTLGQGTTITLIKWKRF